MRYEELVAKNRAAYEQRKKKERQAALIKYSMYAVMLTVLGAASFIIWNEHKARKERESALAAEEARRIEEVAHHKAEERRLAAEEAARKRAEERLARERKLEEERLAREKQREEERLARERKLEEERLAREKQRKEERLAWERKCEEERMIREKERQERCEKLAVARRRSEEARRATQEEQEAKRLSDERKREEERLARDDESRRLRETQVKSRVAPKRPSYSGKSPQTVAKKSSTDDKYQLDFFDAQREMGGSVLEGLVRKLNDNIGDVEMSHTSARNARAVAMSRISGSIGPVEYSRQIKTKKITSTQVIGGFNGYMDGGLVSGTIHGPVTSIKENVGGYVANVPAGFKKGFEKLMTVAYRGHSRANAEAGACIFVDATKGQIGMDERKALTMFAKAADLGDADGMYMQAFCLFYGIGRMSSSKKDVHEAYSILSHWQSLPGSQSLRGSGWAHRRLKEARQLGY